MPATAPAPVKKSASLMTPAATAIFVYVWEPRPSMNEGGAAQYSISLLFKKNADISALKKAVVATAVAKFGEAGKKFKDKPFRSVDEMDNPIPGFRGGVFITAKSKQKPGIVDRDLSPITDALDFYPGCICRATVAPFAFDKKGTKGVTFLLNNLQKIDDGERLDGRKRAEDEFSAIDSDAEDDDEDDDDDDPLA